MYADEIITLSLTFKREFGTGQLFSYELFSRLQVQTLVHIVLHWKNDLVVYTSYGTEIIRDQNKRIRDSYQKN